MTECRKFNVHGRVQGVFFRASTRQKAESLGLTGWVRNCADGSVETLACGSDDALDTFAAWLWEGPEQARVTRVDADTTNTEPPAGFEIR